MATSNRADLIKKLIRELRKLFEPCSPFKDRTLMDNLLFACLLENSSYDAAEKAFVTLDKEFFDLNEVRVSSVRELAEHFKGLNDPLEAADRLKRTLHSAFESVYSFDMEGMKKQNIGQTVKTLENYDGTTPFVVAYVTQNALGGHSIPINKGLLISLQTLGVISEAEAAKGVAPGIERAIPKSKGVEVGSLMHQLGIEVGRSPYSQAAKKLLLEIDPTCKSRLPKRPVKVEPPKPAPKPKEKAKETAKGKPKAAEKPTKAAKQAAEKKAAKEKAAAKKTASSKKTAKKKPVAKPAAKGKVKKKKVAKKPPAQKKPIKKKLKKKVANKKVVKKKATTTKAKAKKKTTSRKLSKKKPR